ncbi:MAG: slipin family protein [Spirochaetales bacterium]|nr:slipin family protein [Spirochaetales bacterium]
MNLLKLKSERIKNSRINLPQRDFFYNAFSWLILAVAVAGGIIWQMAVTPNGDSQVIMSLGGAFFAAGLVLMALPFWGVMVLLLAGFASLLGAEEFGFAYLPLLATGIPAIYLSCAVQLVYQWDKVVILRMGKFHRIIGPGLHLILPLIDRTAALIDTRIRVTDFTAEKSLTLDTVPVHVDALCFWMIWDAQKAILEVEDYREAVALSAQTALRDAIGRHDLASLLSKREEMGREIQQALDDKTNPWGITILSVEFTDVIIPQALEDAMSKKAQAEREKQSRIILSEAEIAVAENFDRASEKYKSNETALKLRSMNMVYEGLKSKEGTLMMMPSSAMDQMNLGVGLGAAALNREIKEEKL